ncbi:MAG TPA: M15 family metallopeptidase [Actinomycetota bacterium]|nr:M15 family metallopeptidase [Actinomycetota bacterium]
MTRRILVLVLAGSLTGGACASPVPGPAAGPRPTVDDVPVVPAPTMVEMPSSPTAAPEPGEPRFEGSIRPIRGDLRSKVVGRSWHRGCPVSLRDLRALEVTYWDFEGDVRSGPLVVHRKVAEDILWVFRRLFRARFPIKHLVLPPRWRPPRPADYWDPAPTSPSAAFNCRPATGSTVWSEHAYGLAIDLNPLQNPYVRSDGTTLRRIARPYRDRSQHRKGMIHDGDVVVRSFAAIGWEWGGHWHTLKDYMHFSLTGR